MQIYTCKFKTLNCSIAQNEGRLIAIFKVILKMYVKSKSVSVELLKKI